MNRDEMQLLVANARDPRLACPENPMGLVSVAQYLLKNWRSQADGEYIGCIDLVPDPEKK